MSRTTRAIVWIVLFPLMIVWSIFKLLLDLSKTV
jgi:hypothetical protein